MNPFEKRDKILRTPPGQSFLDRSCYITLDKSVTDTDCLLYDDSGVRSFCVPEELKRYTLTFDSTKPNRPSTASQSCSWLNVQHHSLFTSSPVHRSLSGCPVPEAPMSTPVLISARPSVPTNLEENQENTDPSSHKPPNTIRPRSKRTRYPSSLTETPSVDSNVSPSSSSFSDASGTSDSRRLRSRVVTVSQISDHRTKRRRPITNDSSHSNTQTVRRGRQLKTPVVPLSSINRTTPETNCTVPSTPANVVAKPLLRNCPHSGDADADPATDHTSLLPPPTTVLHRPAAVVTVKKHRRKAAHKNQLPIISNDLSAVMDKAEIPPTVIRSRVHASARAPECAVSLEVLDISAITPAGRKRKPTGSSGNSLRQDEEPIAARLRRRATQLSYLESHLTARVSIPSDASYILRT
ncbi:hypothetical protein EG68_05230 [Paragonimus skrjabini miyazakii]|uniref:Uncharacterized protein n=1 Tax=Paragonimus skrjabini miyazakii TaxID=59628 RepID=A0A8S9Z3N7_9TREM|nr:hypothetical protein EG68_05230 [Paragonimus skrjabini miyazakii]